MPTTLFLALGYQGHTRELGIVKGFEDAHDFAVGDRLVSANEDRDIGFRLRQLQQAGLESFVGDGAVIEEERAGLVDSDGARVFGLQRIGLPLRKVDGHPLLDQGERDDERDQQNERQVHQRRQVNLAELLERCKWRLSTHDRPAQLWKVNAFEIPDKLLGEVIHLHGQAADAVTEHVVAD